MSETATEFNTSDRKRLYVVLRSQFQQNRPKDAAPDWAPPKAPAHFTVIDAKDLAQLTLLHSLISTQYGNVDDLSSKLRQNRYYVQQVKLFLQDVEAIDVFVDFVADEGCTAGGLPPDARPWTR